VLRWKICSLVDPLSIKKQKWPLLSDVVLLKISLWDIGMVGFNEMLPFYAIFPILAIVSIICFFFVKSSLSGFRRFCIEHLVGISKSFKMLYLLWIAG